MTSILSSSSLESTPEKKYGVVEGTHCKPAIKEPTERLVGKINITFLIIRVKMSNAFYLSFLGLKQVMSDAFCTKTLMKIVTVPPSMYTFSFRWFYNSSVFG